MNNFEKLTLEESLEISGGNRLKKLWDTAMFVYEALQIQDAVNEYKDGWNSVDCDCK